jgi:3-methyladenine DNA glycosylase AlkD
MPDIQRLAKLHPGDHELAGLLWDSDVHEARLLATWMDDPAQVTEGQAERWVAQVASWDVCDALCGNLLTRVPFAYPKAAEWTGRPEEFVKRAGFVLVARLAVRDKRAPDEAFLAFLPLIAREAEDGRNYVKKAVNWALRQIGKRNITLYPAAVALAEELATRESAAARWIGRDALRELRSPAVRRRLGRPE